MIKFICGCLHDHPSDSVVLDGDGFMTCLAHHERRSGWRSLPTVGSRADFSFSSWTPLEIERFLFFSEFPPKIPSLAFSNTEDRRDNRDPEIVGAEIIARRSGNEPEFRDDWPR